jgi:hypothetical protein
MTEEQLKAKITRKCWVRGEQKKPGDVVEGPKSEIDLLCGLNRATKDLTWDPAKQAAEEAKRRQESEASRRAPARSRQWSTRTRGRA